MVCWVLMGFDFVVLFAYNVTVQKVEMPWSYTLATAAIAGFYVTGAVDLLVAIFLCYYLVKNRHHSAQTSIIRILNRLIVMTIITGIVMAFISVIIATFILTKSIDNAWYGAVLFCEGKVSSNFMLLSLNSRSMHQEMLGLDIRMTRIGVSQSLRSPAHRSS